MQKNNRDATTEISLVIVHLSELSKKSSIKKIEKFNSSKTKSLISWPAQAKRQEQAW